MTRAFVAVRLPDAVLDAVSARVADLSVAGRRTTREQWHLTLQFLGDEVDVDEVIAALEGIDAQCGEVRLGGAGAFPEAVHARVLWLGVARGASVLAEIASAVAARTAPLGYEADARPYEPHLTLARYRDTTDLRPTIAAIGSERVGPAWIVDAITVYESKRLADGARHIERAAIPLQLGSLPA